MRTMGTTVVFMLGFFLHAAVAQITVTAEGLKSWVGYTQVVETDTSGSITVNVGSAGANQMWDFSDLPHNGFKISQEMQTAASTPYNGEFPGANFAFVMRFLDNPTYGMIYNYLNIASSQVEGLGLVYVVDGTVTGTEKDSQITPLPITYGSSWSTAYADTFDLGGYGTTITKTSETTMVDAWGRIKLPSGEYPCLRWKSQGLVEQTMVVNGIEFPVSSFTYIDYQWIGENSLYLATASSMEGETDPNFTIASDVSWLSSVSPSTGIADVPGSRPADFGLLGNYPNPFNPGTTITFQLDNAEDVTLAIYDVQGRVVRHLVSGQLAAGVHQVDWNGTNDSGEFVAGGTYFFKLTSASNSAVRKMTLMK